jgi:hypothetical protein
MFGPGVSTMPSAVSAIPSAAVVPIGITQFSQTEIAHSICGFTCIS